MSKDYALYHAELKTPGQSRDVGDTRIAGFWRIAGAKTKPDYPVAVWYDSAGNVSCKIGRKEPFGAGVEFDEFLGSSFFKCSAVREAEYHSAIETGFWADGKPSRKMDDAERHGISTDAGDNAAPVTETIADQISAAVERANSITKIENADQARAANELADKLQALFKLGDAERDKQKRPHDDASKAVQALWLPIITPASDARERLVGKGGVVKQWLLAEQRRIDDEARKERERIAAENERIRQENEKAAAEAAEQGLPEPEPVAAPEPIPAAPPARAQAGNSFGRATGLRKVTRAEITDMGKVLMALIDHKEMREFAQTLANRAAKAGIALDGAKIVETME